MQAGLSNQPDIALGNVVGSNICNVLLILGLSALIMPLAVAQQLIRLDVPIMIGVMVLVRAFEPTKVFDYLATQMVVMAKGQGKRLMLGIVAITTPICAVLPNATTVMLLASLIPTIAAEIGEFLPEVLPLFYAMMLGATLGGNGTLVGASSNIVAAGIAEEHGKRISFAKFLKYGIPTMGLQLLVSAGYILLRF